MMSAASRRRVDLCCAADAALLLASHWRTARCSGGLERTVKVGV